MKYFSYLNSAKAILQTYTGQQPFHLFIKDFFKQHKKYGSSDRREITQLCYAFFRLGKSVTDLSVEDRILIALFLCSHQPGNLLAAVKPDWNEKVHLPVEEKCALVNIPFDQLAVFPCLDQISSSISKTDFMLSHFIQPDIFLRCRPGQQETVLQKINAAGISFTIPRENCIALSNTTKATDIIEVNKEVVIQDYSSQAAGDLLQMASFTGLPKTWDCCAASGGKSIMAKDLLGNINLTVSDIRETVLINLKKRFGEAGLTHYKMMLADVSKPVTNIKPASFQLIIADVPCTGSGTWGRSPERLSFFDDKEIERYHTLQEKIITNALAYLQNDGYLLYITCSVFEKENEEMIHFIKNKGLTVIKMETLHGYHLKADTMFAALLQKSV